jgi:UrcA family protein
MIRLNHTTLIALAAVPAAGAAPAAMAGPGKSRPLARLALAAALFLTGISAPSAFAETGFLTTPVHYADLDLTRKAGVDRLVSRLNRAAEMVCPSSGRNTFGVSEPARTCRQKAIRQAVADIGSAELTARLDAVRPYRLASR